jgi:hypothetical protein
MGDGPKVLLILNAAVAANLIPLRVEQAVNDPDYTGIHLQGVFIDDDEILKSICIPPNKWEEFELLACHGSRIPQLVASVLRNKNSLKRFAFRPRSTSLVEDHSFQALTAEGFQFLQELRLEVNVSEESSTFLAKALMAENGCSLTQLFMQNSSFENAQAVLSFAKGLKGNRSITSLDLSYCQLRDDDLKLILPNLPPTLEVLDLVANYCRSDGMAALVALLLKEDRNLVSLNLTNQHPGEFGGSLDLSLLGLAIVSNTTLRHLDVSFNLLSTNDIRCLVAALSKNTSLETINLMSNQLDDHSMQLIGKYLPRMRGLQKLSIAANRFGEDGANGLLQGLLTNVYLTQLSMPRGFAASDQIDYFLALNQGGRRLLLEGKKHEANVPSGLWSLIFERVNTLYHSQLSIQASVLFHLLQGPVLFGRP